ncbi:hypothetical protein [Polyangium sp. 6x1]|uniref:hypothetical protein n=1 Tax=Polyangium sp. 6x1 TaxID=3042689 RepID=UPI0024825ED4|nr:hypothetical protein [Polyangium sp. 6x1]MDI1449338.1 hypothetical protein [Polyangium sp. 6x1]
MIEPNCPRCKSTEFKLKRIKAVIHSDAPKDPQPWRSIEVIYCSACGATIGASPLNIESELSDIKKAIKDL